jgi:hypothetical protein
LEWNLGKNYNKKQFFTTKNNASMEIVVVPIGLQEMKLLVLFYTAPVLVRVRVRRILLWLCSGNPKLACRTAGRYTWCRRKRKGARRGSRMLLGWVRRIWFR